MKVIKIKNGEAEVLDIENSLDSYHKVLNCNLIDIISLKINNKNYDFIIDDEGKLKEHYANIFLIKNDTPVDYLANDVIICNSVETDDGLDEGDLTELDIESIKNWVNDCEKLINLENCCFSLILKI